MPWMAANGVVVATSAQLTAEKANVAKLQGDLATRTNEIHLLRTENQTLKTKVTALEQEVANSAAVQAELSRKAMGHEGELSRVRAELSEVRVQAAEAVGTSVAEASASSADRSQLFEMLVKNSRE